MLMNRKWFTIAAALIAVMTIGAIPAFAQNGDEPMTIEEYNLELARWQERETTANADTERLEGEIAALNLRIAAKSRDIYDERAELLDLLSTLEDKKPSFETQLQMLKADVTALDPATTEEDLEEPLRRLKELKAQEDIDEDTKAIIADIEKRLTLLADPEAAEAMAAEEDASVDATPGTETSTEPMDQPEVIRLPMNISYNRLADSYTVVRGDNLWMIARKPIIYDDPLQWIKIYSANRDIIRDPDLIYPDQVFEIPREPAPNEHWVQRGESLSSIASQVLNNPFDWTKIYNANKTIIKDPNLILPHTILIIPKAKPVKGSSSTAF